SAEYTPEGGSKVPASTYSGTYELTYQIISGQAMVVSETGTMVTNNYNEATGAYQLYSTETSTTTFEYAMFAGELRMTKSVSDSNTVYARTDTATVDADGNVLDNGTGQHYFSHATITTIYSYDQTTGALIGVSGSGTGYGYELTDAGNMSYTSTIAVQYAIFNGVARQIDYLETRSYFLAAEAPANVRVDPGITGTMSDAYILESGANNQGTTNFYVYYVIDASQVDEAKGDGLSVTKEGDHYLVRRQAASKAEAESLLAEAQGKIGTSVTVYGNQIVGQDSEGNEVKPTAIDFLGWGNGGFDL
ncbi:MAG: hypothetical protein V1919_03680, partial [Candidatus Omnitrophota bacterium]